MTEPTATEIRWTEEASSRLREIFEYIAEDSEPAAGRVVNGIYEKAQSLMHFPDRGFTYTTRQGRPVRVLLYGHYRIVYRLEREPGAVQILGVYHGAMDMDRILDGSS